MKAENKSNLEKINKKLQERIHMLPEEYQGQLQSSSEELDNLTLEFGMLKKGLRVIFFVLFAVILLLIALLVSFRKYSVELEDAIKEKNAIIAHYQDQDSLYSKLLDKNDSLEYVSYRIEKGVPITYHQLLQKYDSLHEKYYTDQLNYENLQEILSLVNRLYPFEVIYEEGHVQVSGPNYKLQLEEGRALIDSLNRQNWKYRDDYEITKLKLELIMKNYPIYVGQDGNRYYVEARKIDSALMLLPYYRDKLTFDPEEKTWIITYTKEEVADTKSKRKKK